MTLIRTSQSRQNPKQQSLCVKLRELAHAKGLDAKLPTVKELCESLGTSQPTLNGALIRLEAERVIYRRDRSGIFVSPHLYSRTVAIVLDTSFFRVRGSSPFWDFLYGLFI